MTITLELSPEMKAKLREGIARRDAQGVRQVLADALTPTVEALLQQTPQQLSEDEAELPYTVKVVLDETSDGRPVKAIPSLRSSLTDHIVPHSRHR